ncbi:MAG: hypothetical protein M1838_003191 [Thelocarpon superellum]|nr:MAG: hypothetical protein M1838_003191 [Thelocarpon superellum]
MSPPQAFEPPHGVKRGAAEQLDNEQRLTKRLSLLQLDRSGTAHVPVPVTTRPATDRTTPPAPTNDAMQVDDTKYRVYIANLDDELSGDESADGGGGGGGGGDRARDGEEKIVFLPDVEERLTRIPRSVLLHRPTEAAQHRELVLYGVPNSLSVPQEEDNVRRAIIESRARAQEKDVQSAPESAAAGPGPSLDLPLGPVFSSMGDDPDAMDLG